MAGRGVGVALPCCGHLVLTPSPAHFFCLGLGMSEDSRDLSLGSQVRGGGVCWAFHGQGGLRPGTG